jgi:hypothetical protein
MKYIWPPIKYVNRRGNAQLETFYYIEHSPDTAEVYYNLINEIIKRRKEQEKENYENIKDEKIRCDNGTVQSIDKNIVTIDCGPTDEKLISCDECIFSKSYDALDTFIKFKDYLGVEYEG